MARDIYEGVSSKHTRALSADLQRAARVRLDYIHYAVSLNDLRSPPGNRLEALRGDLRGKYSIRINKQWRIVFRWNEAPESGAEEVEIIDYH
jgi:proteic killer suppression protein